MMPCDEVNARYPGVCIFPYTSCPDQSVPMHSKIVLLLSAWISQGEECPPLGHYPGLALAAAPLGYFPLTTHGQTRGYNRYTRQQVKNKSGEN